MITLSRCVFVVAVFLTPSYLFAASNQTVRIWHKDANTPQSFDFIKLALNKAEEKHGSFDIESVHIQSKEQAIGSLDSAQQLDILSLALNPIYENKFLPIYIPIDRGLLGFRLCLIHPDRHPKFEQLTLHNRATNKELNIGLKRIWEDFAIFQHNGFEVYEKARRVDLAKAVENKEVDCFSRSLKEIDQELAFYPQLSIDSKFAFIYPLAKIIYVRANAIDLYQAVKFGLEKAVQDGSYMKLYNKLYKDVLEKHEFYFRKLVFLNNPNMSEPGLNAINKYGIASFTQGK